MQRWADLPQLWGPVERVDPASCRLSLSPSFTRQVFYVYVLYSTLFHLSPLRFRCLGGCWVRTQDCCDFGIGIGFTIVHRLMQTKNIGTRVFFETSFDLKQPKLDPKLVSALSETKRLFRLFRFYTETESFGVLIEPKQTEVNRNSLIDSLFLYFFQKS